MQERCEVDRSGRVLERTRGTGFLLWRSGVGFTRFSGSSADLMVRVWTGVRTYETESVSDYSGLETHD